MVVLEINLNRIAVLPSKGEATIPGHCNGVSTFTVAGQRVKAQSEEVEVFRGDRRVQRIKAQFPMQQMMLIVPKKTPSPLAFCTAAFHVSGVRPGGGALRSPLPRPPSCPLAPP